jgi:hypothetical protein
MWSCAGSLAGVALVAGCGGGESKPEKGEPAVRVGPVVYRDALSDNSGGWVEDRKHGMVFSGGRYWWEGLPKLPARPATESEAMLERGIPEGLAVSVAVEQERGAALRVVYCRARGRLDRPPEESYELGIDGRQAIVRRLAKEGPPRVLARSTLNVPNGRRVRLTAHCVPSADGALNLALLVDGRAVARARDPKPLPAVSDGVPGTTGLSAYRRPDGPAQVSVVWDDFEARSATMAAK